MAQEGGRETVIFLGQSDAEKTDAITAYCRERPIRKIFVLSPAKFQFTLDLALDAEHIEWADIIQYKFFYRLLQEIGKDTLVVVNECLRTQDRNDLTYNCIRHFLNQAGHQLVFQYLPLINTIADFMVLFDFDTRSRWKRESFRMELLRESSIMVKRRTPELTRIEVATDDNTKAMYDRQKRQLIDGIGLKDPHTIPRNLYLLSGRAKLASVNPQEQYVGRNNRFGLDNLKTFREASYPPTSTVFEFCHNFIDFGDFLTISGQHKVPVLTADLKVDHWYFGRYTTWAQRMDDAYAAIQQG